MSVVTLEKMWPRSYRLARGRYYHLQYSILLSRQNGEQKLAIHQAIVQAKVNSYTKLLTTIEAAVAASPGDLNLVEKQIKVTEKKSKAEQELLEDPTVELVMTLYKKYSHSNAHRTHREDNHKLSENRAKVYSLLMGQCTVPLKDKMKEDMDWHNISDKYNHIRLLLLI